MKKIFKFILKIGIVLIGIVAILFLVLYIKYNTPLPQGETGEKADQLAFKINSALNSNAYKNTDIISWKVKGFDYLWYKNAKKVAISWDKNSIIYIQSNSGNSQVLKPQNISEKEKQRLIKIAENKFNNDSFWLVAPFKLFDNGVERRYIKAKEDENPSLLITYTSGGSTPGDSYQWFVDENFVPTHYKMWVSILPIKGLPATWSNWKKTETGVLLAHEKKIIGQIPFPMTDIKTENIKN